MIAEKVCSKCRETKPVSEFNINAKADKRLRSSCRPCQNQQRRDRYAKFPEVKERARLRCQARDKKNWRKRYFRILLESYGLTEAGYAEMYRRCGGKCEICKLPHIQGVRRLVVDHDHGTMKARGLLCDKCNTAIGKFGDSVEAVFSAVDYLCRHEANGNTLKLCG